MHAIDRETFEALMHEAIEEPPIGVLRPGVEERAWPPRRVSPPEIPDLESPLAAP